MSVSNIGNFTSNTNKTANEKGDLAKNSQKIQNGSTNRKNRKIFNVSPRNLQTRPRLPPKSSQLKTKSPQIFLYREKKGPPGSQNPKSKLRISQKSSMSSKSQSRNGKILLNIWKFLKMGIRAFEFLKRKKLEKLKFTRKNL